MIEKRSNSGRREKLKKEGLFRRQRGTWSEWMGLSAADAPARGGVCKKRVTRAATLRRVYSRAGPEIGVFERV